MVFFEDQYFSLSVTFLFLDAIYLASTAVWENSLEQSTTVKISTFAGDRIWLRKLRREEEQCNSKFFALLCRCVLFCVGRFYGLVYIGRGCLRRSIRQTSSAST